MEKEKILIIEDDGIVSLDIESRLKKFDYSVPAIATTGEEAIQKVEEYSPDIVLMDISTTMDLLSLLP